MTLALLEEEFRNFHTTIVHFHSQLPGTRADESLIVPYLAICSNAKKIIPSEAIVAFYFFSTPPPPIIFPFKLRSTGKLFSGMVHMNVTGPQQQKGPVLSC
jgi:hypothetical protein